MLNKSLAILLMLASGVTAHAATLSYTTVVAPHATPIFNVTEPTPPTWWTNGQRVFTATNWSQNLALQKFDPALGILNSVTFTFRGALLSTSMIENLDGEPADVREDWTGSMHFTVPGASQQTSNLSYSFTQSFAAYDGIVDFSGASGGSTPPFTVETNSGNPTSLILSTNLRQR